MADRGLRVIFVHPFSQSQLPRCVGLHCPQYLNFFRIHISLKDSFKSHSASPFSALSCTTKLKVITSSLSYSWTSPQHAFSPPHNADFSALDNTDSRNNN